jgi:hypothetical protein
MIIQAVKDFGADVVRLSFYGFLLVTWRQYALVLY